MRGQFPSSKGGGQLEDIVNDLLSGTSAVRAAQPTSEVVDAARSKAPGAEAEVLGLVVGGLADRKRVVHTQRPERRVPDQACPDGRSDCFRIGDLKRLRQGRRTGRSAEAPQAARVREYGGLETKLRRKPWHGRAHLCSRRPIPRAAEVEIG